MGILLVILGALGFVSLLSIYASALLHRIGANIAWRNFKIQIFLLEHKPIVVVATCLLLIICIGGFCLTSLKRESSAGSAPQGMAGPSITPEKESTYEFIVKDCTWDEAFYESVDSGGHLLTIDSEEEYRTVIGLIEKCGLNGIIFYIGAARTPDGADYYWIDSDRNLYGSSINGFPYWLEGEPSLEDENLGIPEDRAEFFYYHSESRWILNDIPNDLLGAAPLYRGKIGYIIEY